jgi:LysM repeat protein
MKKEIQQIERRGLPGGPNEIFTYTTGVFSTEGFRIDSPDVNNYQNIIPSGSITMKERDGSPLRKGPIHGIDNLGNEQIMYPGFDYQFPGNEVTETLLAKMGGGLLDKTIKCGNCGWQWKAVDGGSDLYDCHKCGGKGLVKAQTGNETPKLNVAKLDFSIPKSTGYAWADEKLKQQNKALEEFKKVKTKVDTEVKKIQKKHNVSESTAREVYKRQQGLSEQQQPEEVRQYIPQSTLSKAKEIALNPMTAAGYKVRNEDIPDNFSSGERNNLDTAVDFINPVYYAESAKNLAESQGQVFSDLSEGNFGDAALNQTMAGVEALNFIPIAKGAKPFVQKGMKQLRNIPTSISPELRQGLRTAGPSFASSANNVTNIFKNLEDLNYAKKWAKQYGYKLPKNLERIAQSDELTNRTVRGMMNRHNTFVRGVSTNWDELAKRNPDILKNLEERNINWKDNPEEAAKLMLTEIPPDTGYGRYMMNKGDNALYTSNSIPTAQGYTYGDGYYAKLRRKNLDYSSNNRQDWINNNQLDYQKGINNPEGANIIKTDWQKRFPTTIEEFVKSAGNPNLLDDLMNKVDLKVKNKQSIIDKEWDKHIDVRKNIYNKAEEEMKKIYPDKSFHHVDYFDIRNSFITNADKKALDFTSKKIAELRAFDPIKYEENQAIKEIFTTPEFYKSTFRNLIKPDKFGHYAFKGNPGEQIFDIVDLKKMTPELWENKSRSHIGKYSKKLSALKEGGIIKDDMGQWAHPGKITQIAQEGQEITVDQGDGIKRNILTDSSEYAKLYNEGRIGVQNDDNTISFNPFNEVVVTPYDNQYPFYQELSDEEKKYFNSDSAIGRAVRRKAYTKAPLSEDVTNIAAPIIYGTAAAMLAPYALAPLAAGLEFAGAAAAPYIEGALATSLPGMSSIPGATVGNAINAGFAGHGLANVGPDAVEMYNNPSWKNAGNLAMDVVEIAPIAGPAAKTIGEGLSATRKALGTKEGLLSNAWKYNPRAFKPNVNSFYRQIGETGLADAVESGAIRSANQSIFPRPHFVEGTDFTKLYSTGEGATGSRPFVIFETSGVNQAGEPFVFPANSASGYTPWIAGNAEVPLSQGRILQKDWLQGYKPLTIEESTISKLDDIRNTGATLETEYANPIKNLATTFKNRNKKLITVGAENLDKELLKKIEQLESPEGFNRLVVQEAEMLKRDFPVLEKYGDIEKQAVSNAHTRISELYKTALQGNFNKNYLEAKKLNSELTPNKFGIPRNNAFFRTGLGSSNYSDNAINLSKEPSFRDDLFSKTYYGTEMPGEIAIGREYAEGMPVYDHEINHALQNARNTTLDDLLRKYFNNSENLSKNFSEKTKKAYNYFRKNKQGMPSREPSSFLAEARRSMLERGLIKDIYEPITPKKVFEAMKHFKEEPFINPYTEQSYHRIFDFADDHPKTLKFLSDSFNKLLTLGPIGLGATSQMGEEELVPEMKEGGEPNAQNTTTPSPLVEYVVKKGDTLSKIAAANNTSIASIMRNNESISDPNIISINQKINLVNKNVYTPKEEVYKDWNTIRDKKDKINKLSDEQKIVSYYNDKPEDTYLIVDKKNAVMKLYTGGNLTKSFEVGVGQNPGDAQTVTKVKNGKTDWSAGNKSTGAGIYTISNINPASTEYYNEPAFNLKNENGIEVATTIHGTPKPRRIKFNNGTVIDNRMSNGCINGKCEDLKELYGQLDLNTKVYILPEDEGNNFQIIDGKPALRVSSKNRQRYNQYIDQTGTKQKGQGANQTTNTLVYKPIKAYIDETKFKNDVFQWNDFNDEKEYNNTTKPFIVALTTRKQDVMKAAKISSDVYNELAKMSFGIYGAESNYGDTHSAAGNLARAANKVLDPKSSSSPDYKSKATTYGANENTRSVGLTQIRWNYLNEDEKKALKEVGITSNKDFLDPKKAAIGTVTILGVRYNQQLNDKQKQDVWKYLPTKWNSRSNYADRVKSNSSYLSFRQLDKKQEGGESKPGSLMQAYNSLLIKKKMGGAIANKKQFGGQLNSGNISMYKDYIKGIIGNEEQAIKNYDKLNRIYYSKAKELGMTAANYIMTYL